ncbi:MAG: type II secretion system protein GspL [Thiothrix sp.]|nr:MAG: type II secretion system protein GspL [Thiothrix sp.]
MEYCFIQPDPLDPEQASWLNHTTGQSPTKPRHGNIDDAITQAKGKPVVLVLPGEDILMTQVTLPIRQMSKLRKAIPYALEERLAADVEDLHFAIGQRNQDVSDVAIIEKQRLDQWLEPFNRQQIKPRAVVPDILSLPWKADEWTVLQEDDRALVRTGQYAGFCCDRDNIEAFLSAKLSNNVNPPGLIQDYLCGMGTALKLTGDTPRVETQACGHSPLRIIAQGWHPQQSINLLQGGYNTQTDLAKTLKPWRWAAIIFGLWLAAGFTQKIIERQQLQQQLNHLRTQTEEIFRQTYPGVKRIVNARAQMEQRLKALKGGGKSATDDFLAMLTSSGKVIGQQANISLDNMSYRNGQLNFNITAKSLSQLDSLKQTLQKETGLFTELRSADSSQDQASGQIRLKKK